MADEFSQTDIVSHDLGASAVLETKIRRADGTEIIVHTVGIIKPHVQYMGFEIEVFEKALGRYRFEKVNVKRLSVSEIENIQAYYWFVMCPFGRNLPRTRFAKKQVSVKDFFIRILRLHQNEIV